MAMRIDFCLVTSVVGSVQQSSKMISQDLENEKIKPF